MDAKLSNMFNVILLFSCLFSLLTGCVASGPPSGIEKDLWTGEITGMAKGKISISSWQSGESKNELTLEGQLLIDIESAWGGQGEGKLIGDLKGRIKDGLMEAKISGAVEGASFLGEFIGTMSETQGFGSWTIDVFDEAAGRYVGDWTLQKQ